MRSSREVAPAGIALAQEARHAADAARIEERLAALAGGRRRASVVIIGAGVSGIEALGEQIFHQILDVASGKRTKSETFLMGDNEFIPWQIGAVM